jgi:hypothetical protein
MTQKEYTNPSYKRSDHPSFKEKKHTLLIDTQGASNKDIHTESGTLRFEDGVAVLPDDTRAKDIYDEMLATQATHPDQYTLVEDKPTVNVDKTHRYTFGYSRRFSEAWERAFGNPDNQEDTEKDNGRESRKSTDERAGSGVVRSEG